MWLQIIHGQRVSILTSIIVLICNGILASLIFPHLPPLTKGVPFLILVAFVPLFCILYTTIVHCAQCNYKKAIFKNFIYSLIFGTFFHIFVFCWMVPGIQNEAHISNLNALIVFLFTSPFFAIYYVVLFSPLLLNFFAQFREKLISIPILAVIMTALEVLIPRNIPWSFGNIANCGQYFLQLSSLFGSHTGTFFVFFINVSLAKIFTFQNSQMIKKIVGANVLLITFVIFYGFCRIKFVDGQINSEKIRIGFIQPNFVLDTLHSKKQMEVLGKNNLEKAVMQMNRDVIAKSIVYDNKIPELIIWPESVAPTDIFMNARKQGILVDEAKKLETSFLVEDLIWTKTTEESAWSQWSVSKLIGKNGISDESFLKWMPMPFGEKIPFENIFPYFAKIARKFLKSSYTVKTGNSPQTINIKENIYIAPLICFDAISQRLSYLQARYSHASFYANQASFAVLGESSAGFQFARVAQSRAVENARSLIMVNNIGPSMAFDPLGRLILLPTVPFVETTGFVDIPIYYGRTLFSYVYQWPLLIGAFFSILYLICILKNAPNYVEH